MDNDPGQVPTEPKSAVATPGLLYTCPHCEAKGAAAGLRPVQVVGTGGRVRLTCGQCGGTVELWAGEQPRIAQPGQLNRQMRRAQASQKPVIVPGR